MPRGNKDQRRGYRGGRYRGKGAGRGANAGNSRGRGRGVGFSDDPYDFPVQIWPENNSNTPNRGGYRGRGGGSVAFSQPHSGSATPRRGTDSPRGRGRGRGDSNDYQYQSPRGRGAAGRRGSKLRPDAPLSKLLYEERPLLRPVIFVPSVYTRTLFEKEEDLLQPQVEDIDDDTSHVPTAERIARIFSGGNIPPQRDTASDDDAEETGAELEEIDFEDMSRIREEVDSATTSPAMELIEESKFSIPKAVEERFTGVVVKESSHNSKDEPTEAPEHDEGLVKEAGFYVDTNPTPVLANPARAPNETSDEFIAERTGFLVDSTPSYTPVVLSRQDDTPMAQQGVSTGFYVDTNPAVTGPIITHQKDESITADRIATDALLGEDEEIIVYVAPYPRVAIAPTASESAPSLPSTSILTGTTSTFTAMEASPGPQITTTASTIPQAPSFESVSFSFANGGSSSPSTKKQQPRTRPVFTAGERTKSKAKARKKEARANRRRLERQAMFGSFGAIMSEAQLRGEDEEQFGKGKDPRWEERRRGDSDIDWGDTDEDEDGVEGGAVCVVDGVGEVSNGMGAMELDADIDLDAMKAFVKGMSANGGRHVTMDDIADEERIRMEDAEGSSRRADESGATDNDDDVEEEGSVGDEEEDEMVAQEEELMMGMSRETNPRDSDDNEDDSSDEIDQSPNAGFQARLERLRKNARGKKTVEAYLLSEEDTSDDDSFGGITRAEEDDDFFAHVETLLDEKSGILSSAERKARKRLFRAVQNGNFSDLEEDISPAKHKRNKNIPVYLQDQWDRDRAKKAESKRARAQARLEAAADPLSNKKGGKKGRKAMLAAAKFDPSISIPGRIVNMVTLEQQIRRFIVDIGGKSTMALPPMGKESRKQVHELAVAFNLKSFSKGKGDQRYTTLTKTTRSGIGINERKVRRVINNDKGFTQPGGGKGKNTIVMPKHRDGDEVGKAAPKIGEANVGFKMLASMGWSEGDRIGISGGLSAPLTAVIKNTKLGLGANR